MNSPTQSELGKKTDYDQTYNPDRLYPIARAEKRSAIGIDPKALPFVGWDCWNHYEVSWLNTKGKPVVAIAELYYDCQSPCIIESKSLKLYFNSFNQTQFKETAVVEQTIQRDLEKVVGSSVTVIIHPLNKPFMPPFQENFSGVCIDDLDIRCDTYTVNPEYLSAGDAVITETLYSNLLKSNCLVTHQPDWGSVQIRYTGKSINREGLLRYLVSFRNHNEFHEQCIERIFMDIMTRCKPTELTVYGRYTRRGGLDINPYRSTQPTDCQGMNLRLIRQ